MANNHSAWGMEIGAFAVKAIRLERDGDAVRVTDYAYIPHRKVLTTPDVDQDELIRLSLGQFMSQKTLEHEHLVMSVPGHAAFARFAKLPPVEPKKVPEIVKFEAVQQIPFPIDQVEWDYQAFTADDTPEVEVGIFAITRERVQERLSLYSELGVTPEGLTLSPVAVYNAMSYDFQLNDHKGPLVFLDIGTTATDVIVAEEGRCWIRTFPLGGNHFTEAIANAFKLSHAKAEKLKKEAAASKYAKQIMQAMRPVFSDLLQDLQRSIGYYQTAHSDQELSMMVGLGSTFKIPGLRKFLGQQLQMDVVRLDDFKKIQVTGREAAGFAENAVNMASAYGLALQGVGLGRIDANLMPTQALREQIWHSKTKWFAAAAAIAVVGSLSLLIKPLAESQQLQGGPPAEVDRVLSSAKRLKSELDTIRNSAGGGAMATNMSALLQDRDIWPLVLHDCATALASTDPQAELLGDDIESILGIDPRTRRFVTLHNLTGRYAAPSEPGKPRTIAVKMVVQLSKERPDVFLNDTVAQWLRDNAEREGIPYRIVADSISINPDQKESFEINEDGNLGMAGSGGRPGGRRGGGDRGRPPSPGRTPAAPTGGAGGGMGVGSGGGNPGRLAPTGKKRKRPGGALGGAGASGSASPAGRPGAGAPGRGPGSPGGAPGASDPGKTKGPSVDELAPLKGKDSRYPVGATIYHLPVTFTIEITDKKVGPGTAGQSAAARAGDGEVAS